MAEVKHALLIFSKPPIPGLVKTRLTTKFGGIMGDEQAADFFKRCLFDVTECSMHALYYLQQAADEAYAADPTKDHITYDLWVSTTPAENVQLMKDTYAELGEWPMEIHYMDDQGATFDDHFDYAIGKLFDMGYENFVSIGADVPTIPLNTIMQAFQWLEYFESQNVHGFVCAPCQECGTSLVGWNRLTPLDNQGIYYNMDGRPALDGYMEKVRANDIPTAYFPPVADIDEMSDLAHALSCAKAVQEAAKWQTGQYVPRRMLAWCNFMGIRVSTPPNEEHDPRQYIDNPDGTHTLVNEE